MTGGWMDGGHAIPDQDPPTQTELLRAECDRLGIRWTAGTYDGSGNTHNEDTVTAIWPDGDPTHTLSFEEEDGELFCIDSMGVAQCVAAAIGGEW